MQHSGYDRSNHSRNSCRRCHCPARPRRLGEGRDAPLRRGRDRGRRAARRVARRRQGPVDGRHGTVRVGQVDADAHPGRTRPADVRRGLDRRYRDLEAERQRADEAAPRAHRIRVPVFQPAADADRRGECRPAADDRRDEARQGMGRRPARPHQDRGSPPPPAGGDVGRPAAAGGNRPRARLTPDGRLRRRADGEPRLRNERRDPHARPRGGGQLRPDNRDGHARRACGLDCRPRALPRRRPDRPRHRTLEPERDLARDGGDRLALTAFALRGLLLRKLRTVLTGVAILLGVAMISGTYVLTDSISNAFSAIFTQTYRGTDAVVSGKSAFNLSSNGTTSDPSFDESLLAKVKALPDVDAAIGGVAGEAQLIGRNGKAIVFGGAPNLGFSVDPAQARFNSLTLVSGQWPTPGEVVVDRTTADKKDIAIGRQLGVQAQGPVERLRVSGLVKFGAVGTIGGATLAGFDLRTAQHLFAEQGKLDQIRVAGKKAVSQAKLLAEIRSILPPETQVRSGDKQASSDAKDTNSFIGFLQKFLLSFGGVALFVGAFVIANSLSITIAQRTRDFATLRTIGASRRQVLLSVILEALAIGVISSVVGLFLGLALAKGLFKLFDAVGFTLPNNGLTLETRTIIVALLVGILVTLGASPRPAVRAT